MTHPVYLVRHGQSEWNLLRLTQGQTAHPRLTRLGRQQAEAAAELIAADLEAEDLEPADLVSAHPAATGHRVIEVVSSDLARAWETAEVIAARLGTPVVADPRLREQHLGTLQGRSYEETWAAAQAHDWSDPSLPVAGGESLLDVRDRMVSALESAAGGGTRVLVSHGDAIRAALAHLEGEPPHAAEWVEVPNGAVARFDGAVTWLG